jgi:hypothetical protein
MATPPESPYVVGGTAIANSLARHADEHDRGSDRDRAQGLGHRAAGSLQPWRGALTLAGWDDQPLLLNRVVAYDCRSSSIEEAKP